MNTRIATPWDHVQLLDKLERIVAGIDAYVERRSSWLLGALSLLYLIGTGVLAAHKLMWNDELYTYYIATLSSPSDIWAALMSGAEQIPPLFHLTARTTFFLFGVNPISVRLPEIIGFLIMMICLFRFVSKRSSALYGFVAMLFPLVTDAYQYAYEGRPYGIVLGFSGLALVFWQSATEGTDRRLPLVCLALSLAAALANHYYAILVFFALAVGELVRSLWMRRVDLPIWGAFIAAALLPLLLFSSLIAQSRTYSGTFWSQLHLSQVPRFYYGLLRPAAMPLVTTLFVAAFYATTHSVTDPARSDRQPGRKLPVHELAAALGFTAIPVIAFLLARFVTNAFTSRYAMPAVIGFSVVIAFVLYSLPHGRSLIGATLVLLLSGWFVVMHIQALQAVIQDAKNVQESIEILRTEGDANLPIVASEPHIFMRLAYYAPPDITSRLVYLTDPEASLRHLSHNSVDRGMRDLIKPWFRLPVEEYRPYIVSHQRFLVYGNLGWLNWLIPQLQDDHMRIELKGQYGEEFLLLVSSAS
jgi:hypothetical protein